MDIVKAHLLYRLFIHASDPLYCFPSCSVAANSKTSYASQGADVHSLVFGFAPSETRAIFQDPQI
jgi:hypothetical protein